MRARPGVNRQSPGPHIRQPDPGSLPADHRAAGRSRLPPAHPLPRVLHFITTANAHMNFGQSQFTTTPLPRWKNLTTGRTSSRLSPSPSSAQSVPNHRPLAPTSTQLQSPSDNSTLTDHLLQLRHSHSPLQTSKHSQATCSSSDTTTLPLRHPVTVGRLRSSRLRIRSESRPPNHVPSSADYWL